jgi:hypothetical protein
LQYCLCFGDVGIAQLSQQSGSEEHVFGRSGSQLSASARTFMSNSNSTEKTSGWASMVL